MSTCAAAAGAGSRSHADMSGHGASGTRIEGRHGARALVLPILLCVALLTVTVATPAGQQAVVTDEVPLSDFLGDLETAMLTGDRAALDQLIAPRADAALAEALAGALLRRGVSRVVVRERDRARLTDPANGTALRVLVEIFVEAGQAGRIATFRLDLVPTDGRPGWAIADAESLTSVDGLYRLQLDEARHYAVTNLRVQAEDFELSLPRGKAFAARTDFGITGLVLLGDGTLRFTPRPPAERVQVRLFSGAETLATPFTVAWVRFNPYDLDNVLNPEALQDIGPASGRDLARANEFFLAQVGRSFGLDLQDLSRDTWSLVPTIGDLLADVRTRRFSVLTYARASNEAEDITLFDRERRRNISVYPSLRRLEQRGRGYDEDGLAEIDVLDYVIDATYVPARLWMEGETRLRVRIRAASLVTMTLRLAEALTVHSVRSDRHGRLLALRVRGQNNVILSLPSAVSRDEVLTLTVRYSGRLEPQPPEREVVQPGPSPQLPASEMPVLLPEERWVFSNRSYWHPQNTVTDFATALVRLAVPAPYQVVASGDPVAATQAVPTRTGDRGLRTFEFTVRQPVRYLSWAISRFQVVGAAMAALADPAPPPITDGEPARRPAALQAPDSPRAGVFYRSVEVTAVANPRQVSRARTMLPQAVAILTFYGTLLDDFPYPSFALTLVDHELPGGHSPAYFALVHQPLPTAPFNWRDDPVYFDAFPLFFLAHELAHQFWGQAVGWKSYREQWISEGFAQYFALLYAEHHGGPDVLRSVLARMRSSAMTYGAQGPVTLGYRLGHVRNDSRVFRAIVYNKSALVLHMLRRLLGDEAFFDGLRSFYHRSRFTKVGTDEVRAAFEAASGRSLEAFFERWIHEFEIPRVRVAGRLEGDRLRLEFVQSTAEPHEMPVTVTLRYGDGTSQSVLLPLTALRTTHEIPLRAALRGWEVNEDRAALAEFVR